MIKFVDRQPVPDNSQDSNLLENVYFLVGIVDIFMCYNITNIKNNCLLPYQLSKVFLI